MRAVGRVACRTASLVPRRRSHQVLSRSATSQDESLHLTSAAHDTSSDSFGTAFLRRVSEHLDAQKKQKDFASQASVEEPPDHSQAPRDNARQTGRRRKVKADASDAEMEAMEQISHLLRSVRGNVSATTAYALYRRKALKPAASEILEYDVFYQCFQEERERYRADRRFDLRRKSQVRFNFRTLNSGYTEEVPVHEAEEPLFKEGARTQSIVEDLQKAAHYQRVCRLAENSVLGESGRHENRNDGISDTLAAAFRDHLVEQHRPVLTHELADYENPYMMKRSALERLLQERCVRNKVDERNLRMVLDRRPDLIKLRPEATIPPEVLEPLAAFRGDTRWHFTPRERLVQKLEGVTSAVASLVASKGDAKKMIRNLPENIPTDASAVIGTRHPWQNHIGFESAVPRGTAGGTKFGQPTPPLAEQLLKMRYPTLQRVAHTLPDDPKWRAHVTQTIRVLERSKNWDFKSKLRAVNSMKEIYDNLRPSEEYTQGLDEKLVLNRVPSHLKKKYAKNEQYVRTFPKNFKKDKMFTYYRHSLVRSNAPKR